jgi:adenylate cyclase
MEERRLAAIMFTDIVGYTSLMGSDENKALYILRQNRKFHQSIIKKHKGRWLKEMGDGTLASFQAITNAIYCAGELIKICQSKEIILRIGIHLGEIVEEQGDIFGDGVNVASRIVSLSEPNQILVSSAVHINIKNKPGISSSYIQEADLKNVNEPIKVYAVEVSNEKADQSLQISEPLEPEIKDNSIAVLPFVNMSNDPEQEFFCDGIAEEIINTIVQYPNLKVAGRTSSFSFKGKNVDIRNIGSSLQVSKVLEGSIRKSGDNIRITVQLIETSTGYHIWSKKYDRKLIDVFAIQDEIAVEIGDQLNLTLSSAHSKPVVRKHTQNIEAYQLYFKGRSYFYKRGIALFEAVKCFNEALKIDPEYALAYCGLADSYVMLIFHGFLPPAENWKIAIDAVKEAVRFGPDLAETYNSIGITSLFYEWNWLKSEINFKKAILANPGFIQAYIWYGFFYLLYIKGDFANAINQIKKAVDLDPLSSYAHAVLCWGLATVGRYEEAIREGKYSLILDPESVIGHLCLGSSLSWEGNQDEAINHFEFVINNSGNLWLHSLFILYSKKNQQAKAEKILSELKNQYYKKGLNPASLAIAMATMTRKKEALKMLHIACDIKDPNIVHFSCIQKDGEVLRNLPGYDEIIERLGLTNFYQKNN